MEIRTETEIEAGVARVWAVLADFARYPDWNPFITSVRGALEPGAPLGVTLGLPSGQALRFAPTLSRLEPGAALGWALVKWHPRFLSLHHFFQLRPAGETRTRLTHGADLTGLFVKLAAPTLTQAARAAVAMNLALKERVEGAG